MTVLTDCAQLVKANSIQGTYMTVNLTGLTYSLCGMQLSLSPGWHYCVSGVLVQDILLLD